MSLYNDKGIEELKFKLHGFIEGFKSKTGSDFNHGKFKQVLQQIYQDKITEHMKSAFNTLTPNSLATLINSYDELFDQASAELGGLPESIPPVQKQETAKKDARIKAKTKQDTPK